MDEKSIRGHKTAKIDKTVKVYINDNGKEHHMKVRFFSQTKLTTFVKRLRNSYWGRTQNKTLRINIYDS